MVSNPDIIDDPLVLAAHLETCAVNSVSAATETATTEISSTEQKLLFIILRHVNDILSNFLWQICYRSIRRHYPRNKIVVIDDHSDPEFMVSFLSPETEETDFEVVVMDQIGPGRGELLPYLYLLQHGEEHERAVFVHDSVWIQSRLPFDLNPDRKYQALWDFDKLSDDTIVRQLTVLAEMSIDDELLELHCGDWKGVFGGMTIIRRDFLQSVNAKYDLFRLVPLIKKRTDRMAFERIVACILHSTAKQSAVDEPPPPSSLGNIHRYIERYGLYFGIRACEILSLDKPYRDAIPALKVFLGR